MEELKPGMIIKMRNRLWRVDNIYHDELTATSIDGGEISERHFYQPFENIDLVNSELPQADSIGRYGYNKLVVEANKLNLMNSTAPFLALQRSRIVPNQYQLVPLIMAMKMEKVRMLIADDVGLGKTIEAGLIVSELIARQKIKNILIICPASLREQWQETLEYFFHIDAKVISSRYRKDLERRMPVGANPWSYYKYLITSIDYAKQGKIKSEIIEQKWDLVIIDEAHLVAKPHEESGIKNNATERYRLAKSISKVCEHLLLMTATPHNGYSDTYASLIEMLDVGAVQYRNNTMKVIPEIAKHYIVQRRRKDVDEWFSNKIHKSKSPFPIRDQKEIIIERPKETIEDRVLEQIENYGSKLNEIYHQINVGTYWTATHLHKRALSSPAALQRSLENRLTAIQRALSSEEDKEEDNKLRGELSKEYIFDNDIGEQYSDEEASSITDKNIYGSNEELTKEKALLTKLLQEVKQITPKKDSKLEILLSKVIPDMYKADSHIIIFTKYKDTLTYLEQQILKKYKNEKVHVYTIVGEMNEDKRIETYTQFKKADFAILIATDCISEGMNLQHACSCLVHYELPWNPNRLEQRNGRIDRYAQPKEKVIIRTLVMDNTLETKILKVLVQKARQIQQDYGFTPPYFADTNVLIKLLQTKGITFNNQQLSLFDEENEIVSYHSTQDIFDEKSIKKIQAESFYGQIDIDLDFVEEKLKETYIKVGTKKNIKEFCMSGLDLFGVKYSIVDEEREIYKLNFDDSQLKIPRMGECISFNPAVCISRPDVEIIDLSHPLIKRLIENINYLQYDSKDKHGKIAGIYTSQCANVTAVIFILVRYLVVEENKSILEELLSVPIDIYKNQLMPSSVADQLTRAMAEDNVDVEMLKETIEDLYTMTSFKEIIKQTINNRCTHLQEERKRINKYMLENMLLKEKDDVRIEEASVDYIGINIYYPL